MSFESEITFKRGKHFYEVCIQIVRGKYDDLHDILIKQGMPEFGHDSDQFRWYLNDKWEESKNFNDSDYFLNLDFWAFFLNLMFQDYEGLSKDDYINYLIVIYSSDWHDRLIHQEFTVKEIIEKVQKRKIEYETDDHSDKFFDIVDKRYIEYKKNYDIEKMLTK